MGLLHPRSWDMLVGGAGESHWPADVLPLIPSCFLMYTRKKVFQSTFKKCMFKGFNSTPPIYLGKDFLSL